MRGLRVYLTILVSVLFVFFGVIYWPTFKDLKKEPVKTQTIDDELDDLQLAENYFKKAQYEDALRVISRYADSIDTNSSLGPEWLELLINTSEKTLDIQQLVVIHEYYPEILKKNEKASLLVAESYLLNGQDTEYRVIRDQWRATANLENSWMILDADYLLTQGQFEKAQSLLETKSLQGKDEIGRLVRLALFNASDNPEKSLELLQLGLTIDPTDIDVYLYEIKLLEKLGKNEEALAAYKRALTNNPKSIFLRDQLGDFYARHQQWANAFNTWTDSLSIAVDRDELIQEEILVKAIFLDRMLNGNKHDWNQSLHSNGQLRPLISYLLQLDKNSFIDKNAFSKLAFKNEYLENSQVTYWLLLLDALKNNDKDKALTLIHESPFKDVSFNPSLEFAFLQAINFQKTGSLLSPDLIKHDKSDHPLLKSLGSNENLDNSIQALLKSKEIFSSLALASGWTEAGIELHQMEVFPDHFPEFAIIELTEALRVSRGDKVALDFAGKQKFDINIAFLIQELSARIALEEGNLEHATRIYETISDKSFEAKSYLARKAYKEKNYKQAQAFTEELLQKYPGNALLMENLKKIQEKNV